MNYKITLTDSFKVSIKELLKSYIHIKKDIRKALEILEVNPYLGVSIKGVGKLWKFRVKNSDIKKGKSGGYRLIYFFNSNTKVIFPILIYQKTKKEDLTKKELKRLLKLLKECI